jgi:biopolymer transport protein TolR
VTPITVASDGKTQMWTHKRHTEESTLDMTPLVDVVFLLIVFFMLSTTFIILPGVRIDLPKASAEKITLEKNEVVLVVDKEGNFYFEDEKVTDKEMQDRLAAARQNNAEALVLIEGDRVCDYGRMVDLLGMVRDCGLNRIAIVTKDEKKQNPDGSGDKK